MINVNMVHMYTCHYLAPNSSGYWARALIVAMPRIPSTCLNYGK